MPWTILHSPADCNTSEFYIILDSDTREVVTHVWVNRLFQHTALSCKACVNEDDCEHMQAIRKGPVRTYYGSHWKDGELRTHYPEDS